MFRRGYALFVLFGVSTVAGCGQSLQPVNGVVNLDGKPLAKATVTFVSEDGNTTYPAVTDESGKFSLMTGDKPGIAAGTYKVMVVKFPTTSAPPPDLKPSDPEYMKQMEKNKKDAEKSVKTTAPTGAAGMYAQMGRMPGGAPAPPPPKSELPAAYSSVAKTPVSVTVPLANSPVVIDIKPDAPAPAKK